MPEMGVKSQKRERVRRLLITERYSLIYVLIVDQIFLLRVYDNRTDPERMAF
jgi:plasmid stabilization system protein ParE